MGLSCNNPKCINHACNSFGPTVGETAIITVGKTNYLSDSLLALRCESCNTVSGEQPEPFPGEEAVPILCKGCGKKCGEMFRAYMVATSGGRSLWVRHFDRIQCCRQHAGKTCGGEMEPRYPLRSPLTLRSTQTTEPTERASAVSSIAARSATGFNQATKFGTA